MRIEFYVSKINREIIVNQANLTGETMIHDDFINRIGRSTDGNTGRLTFDVVVSVPIQRRQLTRDQFIAELARNEAVEII